MEWVLIMFKEINADLEFLSVSGEIQRIPDYVKSGYVEEPFCSVVIPSYNYGKYLPETVHSILSQTFQSLEVIIVDDGSTDMMTRAVVQSYIGMPRVQVIFKHNEGLAAARNTGIAIARGKYICCLDSDDLLDPTYLERCIFELESHDNVGFVYSWAQLFGDEDYVWETRDFDIEVAKKENLTAVCGVYRKSDWMLLGGYGPKMLGGLEDWDFWLRLAQLGRCGKVIPFPLFYYRKHGATMWHETAAKQEALMVHIRDRNKALYCSPSWVKKIKQYSSQVSPIYFPDALTKRVIKNNVNKEKKSLLVILPWLQLGGAEILMSDILKGLSEKYAITILTSLFDSHEIRDRFTGITKDIFHYPGNRNVDPQDLRQFNCLMRYLIETRSVEIILGSGTAHYCLALPELKQYYPQIRFYNLLHNDASAHFHYAIQYDQFIDCHICVSEKIKSALVSHRIDDSKVAYIPNGIDHADIFYPRHYLREMLRSEFNIPEGYSVVGFVGRASEEKRPFLFLELISALLCTHSVRGLFVGKGELGTAIQNKIKDSNLEEAVIYIDAIPRSELWKVFQVCDVLVNVSEIEGMPLTVLEALATGCPVAAMEVGHLEKIIVDNKNGILVEKDNFHALIKRVSQLLSDKNQLAAMRDIAVNYIMQSDFTLNKMTHQYDKILQGVKHEATV
jgi:glycosyltransferase involved in cell wall biosynthesis